jgi:glycosyltransferase involved in cell wall biosynthesis
VAVLPSVHDAIDGGRYAKPELLGLALIEAMACGTPAICSDAGAMPEVVEDGSTGWVVPQNDPAALRSRINQLLGNESEWKAMSEQAAAHAREKFTWQRVAERCLEAYRRLAHTP